MSVIYIIDLVPSELTVSVLGDTCMWDGVQQHNRGERYFCLEK